MHDIVARHDLRHRDGRTLHLYGSYAGEPLPDGMPASEPTASHQRYNALRDAWVAVSPTRNSRPHAPEGAAQTSACPLCPGGPEVPFSYDAAVFDNRFPSFLPEPAPPTRDDTMLGIGALVAPARGRCEVVLYTATHTGSLATLSDEELARVVAVWIDRTTELWADPSHRVVLPFENRGAEVGATLSHPHGQIYALDRIPPALEHQMQALRAYRERTGRSLPTAVVAADAESDRCLYLDEHFVAAVPFAPDWPFEVHVRARREGVGRLGDLQAEEQVSLARALRAVVTAYDRAYPEPMAYLMSCLEAPARQDGTPEPDHRLAFEFLPPHRSPEKLKIRATVETVLGLFINDTLPEESAALLRQALPEPAALEQGQTRALRVQPATDMEHLRT